MIKGELPNIADRLIESGKKNVAWGSKETPFTHRQAIATVGVSSFVGAITVAAAASNINPSFPPGETTARLLVDHADQIKDRCLRYLNILNNDQPGVKGLHIGPNLEGETSYGLSGPDYSQPITEIAKRIIEPNSLDVTPQCVIAFGEDKTIGEVITTTAREKEIAQNLLDIVSNAMKPFQRSGIALMGTTLASVIQTFWYGHKGKLDKKIPYSSSIKWLGEQQIRLGKSLQAKSTS